jgi:hypothetical protein
MPNGACQLPALGWGASPLPQQACMRCVTPQALPRPSSCLAGRQDAIQAVRLCCSLKLRGFARVTAAISCPPQTLPPVGPAAASQSAPH